MISFIIPAKNEEKYIAACLRSIFGQKTIEPFEVIVVDNASGDHTTEIVSRQFPRAKLLYQSEPGTNPTRQAGFLASKGELVIFLDADVRLPEAWIDLVLAKLRADPKVVAISGPYMFYDFTRVWNFLNKVLIYGLVYPWSYITNELFNIGGATMIAGNMVIRRWALEKIGGLDTRLKFFGDDTLTGMKLQKIGKVIYTPRYWVWSSARRFNYTGPVKMVSIYFLNYFWILFKGHPYHRDGYDIVR